MIEGMEMHEDDWIPTNSDEALIAIGKIAASVTRIETSLFGHPDSIEDTGLFGEVGKIKVECKEHKKCTDSLDRKVTKLIWYLLGSGVLVVGGAGTITGIFVA